MIKTQYIRVKMIKAEGAPQEAQKQIKRKGPEEQDKIARLYALAQQLHVKIGG